MGYGDEILAAGQAQRLFDATGHRVGIYDQQRRRRWHPIWDGNPILVRPDEGNTVHHLLVSAPNARPYIVYPFTAETGWTFNRSFHARDHVARIYLTDDELDVGRDLKRRHGSYVLIDPWSKHPNLRWPREHWQALIDARPDLTFVQHIYNGTGYYLDRVELVGTPTFRAACGALASASVYVRGESGMCHAAAALGVEQVTIWGGAMDWEVLGGYPKQLPVGVFTPPCGRYLPCVHCAHTMAAILPDDVASVLAPRLA